MNDSIRVEAVYLGDNKSENEVFNKSVTTIGSFHILSENCFEVNFESYPRVFLKFYINEEFKGGVQVDKKSDNKIRHIYVSNLFDGLVFNFSGKSKLR